MTTPAHVPAIAGAALQSFLAAASLHLGEPLADGTRLAAPDAQEAWKALLAADALLRALGPLASDEFKGAFAHLTRRFASQNPEGQFPLPPRFVEELA